MNDFDKRFVLVFYSSLKIELNFDKENMLILNNAVFNLNLKIKFCSKH